MRQSRFVRKRVRGLLEAVTVLFNRELFQQTFSYCYHRHGDCGVDNGRILQADRSMLDTLSTGKGIFWKPSHLVPYHRLSLTEQVNYHNSNSIIYAGDDSVHLCIWLLLVDAEAEDIIFREGLVFAHRSLLTIVQLPYCSA